MFIFLIILLVVVLINISVRALGYRGAVSDHFNGRHFHDFFIQKPPKRTVGQILELDLGVTFFIKLIFSHWQKRSLPQGLATPPQRVEGSEIIVTFINHSTLLIQTEGLNILTDPVWSERASPFPFLGPKRYMGAGVSIQALPPVDIILLSHNHYDHMDLSALRKIVKMSSPTIYTTLGNREYLKQNDVFGAVDMDWGDTVEFHDDISITCVPANHFSGRGLTDRNNTLWAGFVINTHHGNIYFAGDTGFGSFSQQVKKMYPEGFRLAFLPIGAFEPRNFMRPMHMDPRDAVEVYKKLSVKRAIPIHFGTFQLAFDKQDEPVETLRRVLDEDGNKDVRFDVLFNGQSVTIE